MAEGKITKSLFTLRIIQFKRILGAIHESNYHYKHTINQQKFNSTRIIELELQKIINSTL